MPSRFFCLLFPFLTPLSFQAARAQSGKVDSDYEKLDLDGGELVFGPNKLESAWNMVDSDGYEVILGDTDLAASKMVDLVVQNHDLEGKVVDSVGEAGADPL